MKKIKKCLIKTVFGGCAAMWGCMVFSGFTLADTDSSLTNGSSLTKVDYKLEGIVGESYSWKGADMVGAISSDPSIVTIEADGSITVNGYGQVTLMTKQDQEEACEISCQVIPADGLHQSPSDENWYYCESGEIVKEEAVVRRENNWWYVNEQGMVDTSVSGLVPYEDDLWLVEDGKVNFSSRGIYPLVDRSKWYYVEEGKVDFSYTGIAENSSGRFYVKDGQVDFTYTSLVRDYNGWWYVLNGVVQEEYTGFAKNENGWFYLSDGRVNFTKSGVFKNEKDGNWYYVKNGQVDFSYNGLTYNSNGTWVVKNGQVNFDYSGKYSFSGLIFTVLNGKCTFVAG